jgi:hypothetical protein
MRQRATSCHWHPAPDASRRRLASRRKPLGERRGSAQSPAIDSNTHHAQGNAMITSNNTATDSLSREDAQLRRQARRRVELKLGWLKHATIFVLVNLGLHLLGDGQRWTQFPLWGWGLGLSIHGLVTLMALGSGDLRERMLSSELARMKARG